MLEEANSFVEVIKVSNINLLFLLWYKHILFQSYISDKKIKKFQEELANSSKDDTGIDVNDVSQSDATEDEGNTTDTIDNKK